MGNEFNLSEKRTYSFNGNLGKDIKYCYEESDIKEFIKKLKKELECEDTILRIIDKLVGDKLI